MEQILISGWSAYMKDEMLIIAKEWTGSIMSKQDIKRAYDDLTLPKRGYLYKEAKRYIKMIDRSREKLPKEHLINTNFDSNLAILCVNLNVIASNNDVDPAIVFLSAIDKLNKKY